MLEFARSAYFKSNGYESLDLVEDILSELDIYDRYMDQNTQEGKTYLYFQWFIMNGMTTDGLDGYMEWLLAEYDNMSWLLAMFDFRDRLDEYWRE